jgi:3,4-dihydroxy 2-butanone 4-phosphate synthase/GTP cyclohydrolase II
MATAARGINRAGDKGAIPPALAAIAAGEPVVVVDDKDRENEGDLIVAAELVTPATMAFLVRHTSGFVCVALPGEECDRLDLPPMRSANHDTYGTAYTVTVDATQGVTTGISARDRAHTARVLADPRSLSGDLTRPGHVVPLRARDGGVLRRAGHPEAAVDLTRMAGLRPAGVLCEVVSTRHPGQMARRPELVEFATEHGLQIISIGELAVHRRRTEPQVLREAVTSLPTEHGSFRVVGYRGLIDGDEHIALVCGEVAGARKPVRVHIHRECLMGDVLGSRQCQCRRQLTDAMDEIAALGRGVIVYLRDPISGLRQLPTSVTGQRGCCSATEGSTLNMVAAEILKDLCIATVNPTGPEGTETIPLSLAAHGPGYAPDLAGAAS